MSGNSITIGYLGQRLQTHDWMFGDGVNDFPFEAFTGSLTGKLMTSILRNCTSEFLLYYPC